MLINAFRSTVSPSQVAKSSVSYPLHNKGNLVSVITSTKFASAIN
uniref:Uncharacterized protein n=1 Tax=Arundo donax TaxID=35708 RepID=A0A0A8Z4E8_ARUDO